MLREEPSRFRNSTAHDVASESSHGSSLGVNGWSQSHQRTFLGFLIGLTFAAGMTALEASPLKNPKRNIGQSTVDLTPLFHWWTNRAGARPLKAWIHVTGSIVGTNSSGWEIVGHAESRSKQSEARMQVRNPPRAEPRQFEELKSQLKKVSDQKGAVTKQIAETHKQYQRIADQQKTWHHSRVLEREAVAWRSRETQEKGVLKDLEKQEAGLKAKLSSFPDPDRYAVDWLVLDTGERINEMPVFDYGAVLP